MDGPTDTRSYRVASSRLEIKEQKEKEIKKEENKNKEEEEQRDREIFVPSNYAEKKSHTCYVHSIITP